MQWWNDFLGWFSSDDGRTVLSSAVIPFVAILVAGIVAAAIGRGSTKRLLTLNDRENRIAAVATMIGAARRASVWNTLPLPEQQHADHVASEADVRVRLLAVPGSGLAADWAAHEFATMKRNSVSFSFQAEQSLIEFRDRMVTWQAKPTRARKLFKADLESWAYEDAQSKSDIVSQQQAWAAAQVKNETGPISTVEPSTADVGAPHDARSLEPAASSVAAPASAASAAAAVGSASISAAPIAGGLPTGNTPMTRPTVRAAGQPSDREPGVGAGAVGAGAVGAGAVGAGAAGADSVGAGPEDGRSDEGGERTSDGRPVLVEPSRYDNEDDDDEPGRSLDDALYSPPVTANTVTKRINPQQVGDDGRSR